jgi:TatD DNase family protein
MKIIDAHSHTDYITHIVQSDVVGTVCCTTDESQWKNLIDIISEDNRVYGAFGVHPWFVENIKAGFENRLYNLLKKHTSLMVGEIGLDKYKPNMDKQIEIFKKQFDIAVRLHRSMFLHCVGAWDKIFNILKQYKKSELPIIVVHDFHGSDSILLNLIKNYNIMFSFNKIVKPEQIRRIPENRLLIETDAKPDVCLVDVIHKIANIKENDRIWEIIYNNTKKVLEYGQITSY